MNLAMSFEGKFVSNFTKVINDYYTNDEDHV